MIKRMIMFKSGKRIRKIQGYICENGHFFQTQYTHQWNDTFIEFVVFLYLRCLSLNTTIDIVRATYEEDLLTKKLILDFIEQVADALPTLDDIDRIFEPKRSGYLAFDGVWFSYLNREIVLLVCFDPDTFDVVSAVWRDEENQDGYDQLIQQVLGKIPKEQVKGVYGDGDKGLLSCLKTHIPNVPFQLCVTHKELRMGQLVPVKIVARSRQMNLQTKIEITRFAGLFREAIYARSEKEAYEGLEKLKVYVQRVTGPNELRFMKAYRSLKRNFELTLTHFRVSGMTRDDNLIECFNGCLKPRLRLMKSFKKAENLNRYLKLFLLEFRFRPLRESTFKERRHKTPLELGGVYLGLYWNFITYLRQQFKLSFQPKIK